MRPMAAVTSGEPVSGRDLEHEILVLSERARAAGFAEVGHWLAVAGEALEDALAARGQADSIETKAAG